MAALLLLLDNDLGQYRAGDVFTGLGVMRDKIAALLDQFGEVVERDITARCGVVETSVGVFLDDDRFGSIGVVAARGVHVRGVSPRGEGPSAATIQSFGAIALSKTRHRSANRLSGLRRGIY